MLQGYDKTPNCRNCKNLSVWPNRYDRCYVQDVGFSSEHQYSAMADDCEYYEERHD